MNVFDLTASLTLDTREYERALNTAKGTTVSATTDIGARVSKMKKGFLIGAGAMAAGFAAFGVSSIKTGMEFDSAMSQVSATMGKTNKEMLDEVGEVDLAWGHFSGNLREYAQEMGAHTKYSATESAEALNYMALAGYDAQKSMEMLPSVLNLAAAGNMELARASDMVTDASSALGLSQEETTDMVDKMAMAASKSNTSVEQLGDAFLTVGGTAKNLKGGTTELSTALGILADSGIKGSEGGTILRNAILSLTAPTSKAKGELEALGVSAYDSEGNMRGLDEIFGDLNSSLSNLTGEERAEALGKIFNKRDLKGIEALLGNAGQRWDDLSGYIDEAQGSAQKMADTQLDNLEGDITLLKSAFEGLKIGVSDKLTPVIRKFVKALTWCIDHAKTLGPIILGLATAFTVFAVAINIGPMIQKVTAAMAAFNAILLANPIGLIVAAIAGLVVAFIALWKNNEKFREKVIAIWNAIKKAALTVWNAIKEYIVVPIQNAFEKVRNILNKVKSFISSIFGGIKNTASKTWSKVKDFITHPIETAKNKVKSVFISVKNFISSIFGKIKDTASKVWEEVKDAIWKPIKKAKDKVKEIIDKIKEFFPFNVGKLFSGKVPDITVKKKKTKDKMETNSTIRYWRFAKAMSEPYMFSEPTAFYAGEAGDEILYGRNNLLKDIRKAAGGNGDIVINLNYQAGDDANEMLRDIARGVRRYRMAGAL